MLSKGPRAASSTAWGAAHPGQQHSGQGSVMFSYTHQTWKGAGGSTTLVLHSRNQRSGLCCPHLVLVLSQTAAAWLPSPTLQPQSHRSHQPPSRQGWGGSCEGSDSWADSSSRWTEHLHPGLAAEPLWGEARAASGGHGHPRIFQQVLQDPNPSAPEPPKPWQQRGRWLKGAEAEERKAQQQQGTKEGGQGGEKGHCPPTPATSGTAGESHYRWMRVISASIHFESTLFQRQAAYATCTSDFSHLFWAQMEHNGISEGGILLSEIEDCF